VDATLHFFCATEQRGELASLRGRAFRRRFTPATPLKVTTEWSIQSDRRLEYRP
jgi:hypothetical protein